MITRFTIFGERCSGTNYLQELITTNFDLEFTSEFGWKHFFKDDIYYDNETALFIGIIRNPIAWLNSFYQEKHHVPKENLSSLRAFLFNKWYSIDNGIIINDDKNWITNDFFKNIFELRNIKNDYLINIMPQKVKNYSLIRYEDLAEDHHKVLDQLATRFNLVPKFKQYVQITYYKQEKKRNFTGQKAIQFTQSEINTIIKKINIKQESYLGYNFS